MDAVTTQLKDVELKKMLDLRTFSESAPIHKFFRDSEPELLDSPEAKKRTIFVGDLRITYIVTVHSTSTIRNISIATPLKTQYIPIIAAPEDMLNAVLGLFGFRYRFSSNEKPDPRSSSWLDSRRGASLNVSELVGETDEEFVAKVLGSYQHLVGNQSNNLN